MLQTCARASVCYWECLVVVRTRGTVRVAVTARSFTHHLLLGQISTQWTSKQLVNKYHHKNRVSTSQTPKVFMDHTLKTIALREQTFKCGCRRKAGGTVILSLISFAQRWGSKRKIPIPRAHLLNPHPTGLFPLLSTLSWFLVESLLTDTLPLSAQHPRNSRGGTQPEAPAPPPTEAKIHLLCFSPSYHLTLALQIKNKASRTKHPVWRGMQDKQSGRR